MALHHIFTCLKKRKKLQHIVFSYGPHHSTDYALDFFQLIKRSPYTMTMLPWAKHIFSLPHVSGCAHFHSKTSEERGGKK
jgi:hypothetical protein